MPYVRISIMSPNHGHSDEVARLAARLNALAAENPGCLETYLLRPHDESGDIARMAIYDNEHSAEAAAQHPSVLAVRSELHLLVKPGHIERAFFTEES